MKRSTLTQIYTPIKDFVQSHFHEDKDVCTYTSKIPENPFIWVTQSHPQTSFRTRDDLFGIAFALNVTRQRIWKRK